MNFRGWAGLGWAGLVWALATSIDWTKAVTNFLQMNKSNNIFSVRHGHGGSGHCTACPGAALATSTSRTQAATFFTSDTIITQ